MQPGTDSVSSTANGGPSGRPGAEGAGREAPRVSIDAPRKAADTDATIQVKSRAENLSFFYGDAQALKNLTIEIRERRVTRSVAGRAGYRL